jgi:hypothetical protein
MTLRPPQKPQRRRPAAQGGRTTRRLTEIQDHEITSCEAVDARRRTDESTSKTASTAQAICQKSTPSE